MASSLPYPYHGIIEGDLVTVPMTKGASSKLHTCAFCSNTAYGDAAIRHTETCAREILTTIDLLGYMWAFRVDSRTHIIMGRSPQPTFRYEFAGGSMDQWRAFLGGIADKHRRDT